MILFEIKRENETAFAVSFSLFVAVYLSSDEAC